MGNNTIAIEQVNKLGLVLSVDAWPSPADLEMARQALIEDGSMQLAWHDRGLPTKESMWEEAQRLDVVYFTAWCEHEGAREFAGLGWAVDIEAFENELQATVGQCFMRTFQVKNVSEELASMMLDYGFQKLGIKRMNGFTPVPNKAACRFVRKMRFERIGVARGVGLWQGKACDILVSTMTRNTWNHSSEGL